MRVCTCVICRGMSNARRATLSNGRAAAKPTEPEARTHDIWSHIARRHSSLAACRGATCRSCALRASARLGPSSRPTSQPSSRHSRAPPPARPCSGTNAAPRPPPPPPPRAPARRSSQRAVAPTADHYHAAAASAHSQRRVFDPSCDVVFVLSFARLKYSLEAAHLLRSFPGAGKQRCHRRRRRC